MKWCHAASLSALSGVIAALAAAPAVAADRPCPPMVVEADAGIRARWPDARRDIRAAFDDRDDIDTCARIELTLTGGAIAVKVALPDGRSATRTVLLRQDVVTTLQALLLVPRPPAPVTPATPVAPEPSRPLTPPARTVGAREVPAPASSVLAARRAPVSLPVDGPGGGLAVELSIGVGARIGDGQTGGGFAVLSFLDLAGWLVGFEGRVDSYQPMTGGPAAGALGLALLGGRRFRFGTLALDLVGGPAIVHEGGSMSVSQRAPGEPVLVMERRDENLPRLRLGARLNFRARSVFRTFVGLDGDFGEQRDDVNVQVNAPAGRLPIDQGRLPAWTLGLVLGATVGTL
jgi:hypothetical protein